VNPTSISLGPAQQQQFVASTGETAASGATWSIAPQAGTISASGLYTAPASISSALTVTVTATIGGNGGTTAAALVSLVDSASTVGLAAYLPFDEASGIVAFDASGNANN